MIGQADSLSSRRSTELAAFQAAPPPSVKVFTVEKAAEYKKCTAREARTFVEKAASGGEAPLLPRVFLRAKALGASPQATDLLSKVGCHAPACLHSRLRRALLRARPVRLLFTHRPLLLAPLNRPALPLNRRAAFWSSCRREFPLCSPRRGTNPSEASHPGRTTASSLPWSVLSYGPHHRGGGVSRSSSFAERSRPRFPVCNACSSAQLGDSCAVHVLTARNGNCLPKAKNNIIKVAVVDTSTAVLHRPAGRHPY